MFLRTFDSGSVTIELDPGLCLVLADACLHAADDYSDDRNPAHANYLWALKAAFEGYALIGDAGGYARPGDLDDWNLATTRKTWGTIPNLAMCAAEIAEARKGGK